MNNKIHICDHLGFCGGVRNAVWNSVLCVEKKKNVFVFGDLIHNDRVLQELRFNGIEIVKDIEKILPDSCVVIPAHGITKENLSSIQNKTKDIVDMTCPMVVNMKKNLLHLSQCCDIVILIGKKNHTEITGAISFTNTKNIILIETLEELKSREEFSLLHKENKKIGLISQTTASSSIFFAVQQWLKQYANLDLETFNTLCPTVMNRQKSADTLAQESDAIIVVGDKRSSNTYSLYEIAQKRNSSSFLVTSDQPINLPPFEIAQLKESPTISILGGTSSPYYVLDETVESLKQFLSGNTEKKPVIVIYGPTAVGKSEFAEELATSLGGELVNYDSMQVYKHLTIGTAKPDVSTLHVPAHLYDYIDPHHRITVASYQKTAVDVIHQIHQKNKIPILIGGSYLYVSSLIHGLFTMEDHPELVSVRSLLWQKMQEKGIYSMYNSLLQIDPVTAAKIHPNDQKRVLRALEVYELTGKSISDLQQNQTKNTPFFFIKFGLLRKPEVLYQRIHTRIDVMLQKGLLTEIKWLLDNGYKEAVYEIKAHGYRELMEYTQNEISFEEAIEKMKINTRHYAKRQLSWLRQRSDFHLINLDSKQTNAPIDIALEMMELAIKHSSVHSNCNHT